MNFPNYSIYYYKTEKGFSCLITYNRVPKTGLVQAKMCALWNYKAEKEQKGYTKHHGGLKTPKKLINTMQR